MITKNAPQLFFQLIIKIRVYQATLSKNWNKHETYIVRFPTGFISGCKRINLEKQRPKFYLLKIILLPKCCNFSFYKFFIDVVYTPIFNPHCSKKKYQNNKKYARNIKTNFCHFLKQMRLNLNLHIYTLSKKFNFSIDATLLTIQFASLGIRVDLIKFILISS